MDRPAPAYRGGHTGRAPSLGLLFFAHFRTLCCYPRHNFAAAHPLGVVIRDTIFTLPGWSGTHSLPPRCCYPAHNFTRPLPPRFPWQSCYPAHILQLCSALPAVVIQHTFYAWKNAVVIGSTILPCGISAFCSFLCCYSAHILQFVEFRQGCYSQHNSQKRTLLRRSIVVIQSTIPKILFQELLFAAHFRKICIFLPLLLRSAQFFPYAGHGCYRQHNSGLQDFCFRGC